jgi:hypothetical protein
MSWGLIKEEVGGISSMHGRNACKILAGKLKGRDYLRDLGVDNK